VNESKFFIFASSEPLESGTSHHRLKKDAFGFRRFLLALIIQFTAPCIKPVSVQGIYFDLLFQWWLSFIKLLEF
jgi:hypothetical protein